MLNLSRKIYEYMENVIIQDKSNKKFFWYNNLRFEKVSGKSLVQSFFIAFPEEAMDAYDSLFDEVHPY